MQSASDKPVFFVRNDAVTLLQGQDCLNVIDRLVSSKISDIPDMSRKNAIFCDYNGKIIDFSSVFNISGSVVLFSSIEAQDSIRSRLVDGKSWDEDCEIMIANDAIFRIYVIFRKQKNHSGIFEAERKKLVSNDLVESGDYVISRFIHSSVEFLEILVKSSNLGDIKSELTDIGCLEIGLNEWESIRIPLGIPSNGDYSGNLPGEMGMESLVSNDKGCYPGQEVHARIDSRGRIVKKFCLISGKSPLEVGKYTSQNLGSILVTSTSISDGFTNALALVRTKDSESGIIKLGENELKFEKLIFPY